MPVATTNPGAPAPGFSAGRGVRSRDNLAALDYRLEAGAFSPAPPGGIIDAHTHVHGARASLIYREAARLYGVRRTYTMTQLPLAPAVRDAYASVGDADAVRFIAFPSWSDPDKPAIHREGYLRVIERFHAEFGARMLKLWCAPRLRELVPDGRDCWEVDSPWRVRACELGRELGMMFLAHLADPDTWFASKYSDAGVYGSKRERYDGLERMLQRFDAPWIVAHFGGWPEDLEFLHGLLSRHANLHLDLSATRWMVRELSRHPLGPGKPGLGEFCRAWSSRLIFGTDIVTTDDHLSPVKDNPQSVKADQASSPAAAFDLYASRFWALRALLESRFDGPSPIADPDLAMTDPARFDADAAPGLRGAGLDPGTLGLIYRGNADRVIGGWERAHP
jgi:hypothetical protein